MTLTDAANRYRHAFEQLTPETLDDLVHWPQLILFFPTRLIPLTAKMVSVMCLPICLPPARIPNLL